MRIARRLRALDLRRRSVTGFADATMEPDPGPPPEAVFDRLTGPFDRRRAIHAPGAADEET
jgi:hypothetical protein